MSSHYPYKDLRDYIDRLEETDELVHVKAQVDWNLEVGAITRRSIDLRERAPLFENIKDYPGQRLLGNPIGPTKPLHGRYAISIGLPKETPPRDLVKEVRKKMKSRVEPKSVSSGPVKENIETGSDVNILKFPAPFIHAYDGGRYIGTWHVDVTADADSDWVNWGMYRHMVHDQRTMGWLWSPPRQHGTIQYLKYEARDEAMPMATAFGTDPTVAISACTSLPAYEDEADFAGGLRDSPVELVKCETVDLKVPATAEIVFEGEVPPKERKDEGRFGEYTGYSASERGPRPFVNVKCVTYRDDPIMTMSNMGKLWDENAITASISRSAMAEEALARAGLPFKEVYHYPPHSMIVSSDVQPPGYAQMVASVLLGSGARTGAPYIVLTGGDVDVTDPEDLWWAITTRANPQGRVRAIGPYPQPPLNPYLNETERRMAEGYDLLIDANFERGMSPDDRPIITDFSHAWPEEIQEKVLQRWREYGYGD